jgi:hypothetical protein
MRVLQTRANAVGVAGARTMQHGNMNMQQVNLSAFIKCIVK